MLHDTARPTVHTTALQGLKKIHSGKVRDIYEIDAHSMLIVTTDRLSAFDVVLPDPIPDKGRVLNTISNFWFAKTAHLVPNHLTGRELAEVISDPAERALLADSPVPLGRLWCQYVNEPQNEAELAGIRRSIVRGQPFGGKRWQQKVTKQLGLEHTFRPRGRPKKAEPPNHAAPQSGK